MIKMIKSVLGISKLTTPLLILGGIVFSCAAAAAWMREDALKDCNASWELKIASETLALKNRAIEAQAKVTELAAKLQETEEKLKEKHNVEAESLAHARTEFPLSDACAKCRVPNERIWVRTGKGSKLQSTPSGKPAS